MSSKHEKTSKAEKSSPPSLLPAVRDAVEGLIYGNCIGDAIGLLTEFMSKEEAEKKYPGLLGKLEYKFKVDDSHRIRWRIGDWTDDSDQMILIMQTIIEKQEADPVEFGRKLLKWMREGFKELGDKGGLGIGQTTVNVLRNPNFYNDPHTASTEEWVKSGKSAAPNGAVMRTAVLGAFQYTNISDVIHNTRTICVATHADPRCQASCIAVTTAIAQLLALKAHNETITDSQVDEIISRSGKYATEAQSLSRTEFDEFQSYLTAPTIRFLNLDERDKIGYTLKCMGAGFWALRQGDFRTALEAIVYEGGDADTNGAVAGALLGCKLGFAVLPNSWRFNLLHKAWLRPIVNDFITTIETVKPSKHSRSHQRDRLERDFPPEQSRHGSHSGSHHESHGSHAGSNHGSHTGTHGSQQGSHHGSRHGSEMSAASIKSHKTATPDLAPVYAFPSDRSAGDRGHHHGAKFEDPKPSTGHYEHMQIRKKEERHTYEKIKLPGESSGGSDFKGREGGNAYGGGDSGRRDGRGGAGERGGRDGRGGGGQSGGVGGRGGSGESGGVGGRGGSDESGGMGGRGGAGENGGRDGRGGVEGKGGNGYGGMGGVSGDRRGQPPHQSQGPSTQGKTSRGGYQEDPKTKGGQTRGQPSPTRGHPSRRHGSHGSPSEEGPGDIIVQGYGSQGRGGQGHRGQGHRGQGQGGQGRGNQGQRGQGRGGRGQGPSMSYETSNQDYGKHTTW